MNSSVEIDTLWNVKSMPGPSDWSSVIVEIDTLWNVKQLCSPTRQKIQTVEIDTLWNVKINEEST